MNFLPKSKNRIFFIIILIIILIIIGYFLYPKMTSNISTLNNKMVENISSSTIKYFGNEAYGDLNGDGLIDKVYLITKDGGGSGTFFYAVADLKTKDGYKTTNDFFIGDRIAPQATEIWDNGKEIHINFAERNPGEPMTTKPSVGAVLLLKVTPEGKLVGLMQ